jgi:hypothetical protein
VTAPAGEQSFQVMEKAIGITAEPIMMPMNCKCNNSSSSSSSDVERCGRNSETAAVACQQMAPPARI